MSWTYFRIDFVYNRLLVILEATSKLMPFYTSISGDSKFNITKEIRSVLSCRVWTSNFCPTPFWRLNFCVVQSAKRLNFWSKSLAFYDNFSTQTVTWTTSRRDLGNIIKCKSKIVFIIILPIESHLKIHFVSFWPTTRCNNFNRSFV
jgi:hypothetical protein